MFNTAGSSIFDRTCVLVGGAETASAGLKSDHGANELGVGACAAGECVGHPCNPRVPSRLC